MTKKLKKGTQHATIVKLLREGGKPLTRSEISKKTGLTINAVSGRVKELVTTGLLVQRGKRTCSVTKKTVFTIAHRTTPSESSNVLPLKSG